MAALEEDTNGPPSEALEEDDEPHSDDESTDKLEKPVWVGYFRLPREDVEVGQPFLPKGTEADVAKRSAVEIFRGWWTKRKTTGEVIESRKPVLIKSVQFLSEREARILSIIARDEESATRNLIRFYGAIVYPAVYRIVLEHCDLGYLRDYVLDNSKVFDPKDFAKQIANGMRYLHYRAPNHPIIHRNLHPLSVLLKSNGSNIILKLHGFQHAKILGDHDTFGAGKTVAPTNPGLWLGPEINLGITTTDPASDVYSFGMVVWHLFSRKLPFEGQTMTEAQIMRLTGIQKERPATPPCEGCPQFWVTLIKRCWQDKTTDRPDFIKIVKAVAQEEESLLDPHKPLPEALLAEKERRENWELDPDSVSVEGDQILSSNMSSSAVVVATCQRSGPGQEAEREEVVLKKPVKPNTDKPTKSEFQAFMETARKISHDHILSCEGVIRLQSIQMPIMELSVRQYMKGKRVKDAATNSTKTVFKGVGLRETQVIHIMRCVLKGLHYLHTTAGIAHGGLSTSNVLINKKVKKPWEVRLCDYNLSALGIESQSHAKRFRAPSSVEGKPRGDIYSCSIMFVEMLTGKDHTLDNKKKEEAWKDARREVKRSYSKCWEAVAYCEDCNDHVELTARKVLNRL